MSDFKVLSLFTGIGLHDLGLQRAGMTIAGQCEIDPFCSAVLEKHWPGLPRWKDVRDVTAESVRDRIGHVDLITGGFPCQDISVAGRKAGLGKGTRSGLWRELFRVVRGVKPAWCLIENVPRLRAQGYERIVDAMARIGYAVTSAVVGAWTLGAPHERNRVWIVANASGQGRERHRAGAEGFSIAVGEKHPVSGDHDFGEWGDLAASCSRLPHRDGSAIELARRELKALGNANPPHIPELIGRWILAQEGGHNVAA